MAGGLIGAAGSSRGRQRRAAMASINITPLVDVLLVLLIIFMVTAPLLQAAIPIALPDSKAKPTNRAHRQVTVTVAAGGKTYLDGTELEPELIARRIAVLPRDTDGSPPIVALRADRSIGYGRVIAVMGDLNQAGITAISLVTGGPAGSGHAVASAGESRPLTPKPSSPA